MKNMHAFPWQLGIMILFIGQILSACGQDPSFSDVTFRTGDEDKDTQEPEPLLPPPDSSGSSEGEPTPKVETDSDDLLPEPTPAVVRVEDLTPDGIATACKNRETRQHVQSITFEAWQGGCAWNQEGNLDPIDGRFQAIRRTQRMVDLPEDAVICGIDFTFNDLSGMRYDDLMFLTMNDMLLTSTETYNEHFTRREGEIVFFNWQELRAQEFDRKDDHSKYCLGKDSICTIPAHDMPGDFSLQLSKETIYQLSSLATQSEQLSFSWIMSGDNDGTDCSHDQDVTLDLSITYY